MNATTRTDSLADGLAPAETRRAMLREAMRVRMIEEGIIHRYGEKEMRCPTHLCIGQEAPPVGVSQHLEKPDYVFSAHRSHGHYLAKGGSLDAMLAELYGRATGCARGKGGSQHLIDLEAGFMGSAPILASTISVGVGAAWAAKRRGEDRVVVIYFGDGATEEGAFHEALNFAGVNKVPVVFVCENNLYSVHTPMEVRQPVDRPVHALAKAHGALGLIGDGNDIDTVWSLSGHAVAHARRGDGPVLLEFMTYRWCEHCGPNGDLDLGYRSASEMETWTARDPIATYERRLTEAGVVGGDDIAKFREEIAAEIEDAFDFARSSPFPEASELDRFVFPNEEAAGL